MKTRELTKTSRTSHFTFSQSIVHLWRPSPLLAIIVFINLLFSFFLSFFFGHINNTLTHPYFRLSSLVNHVTSDPSLNQLDHFLDCSQLSQQPASWLPSSEISFRVCILTFTYFLMRLSTEKKEQNGIHRANGPWPICESNTQKMLSWPRHCAKVTEIKLTALALFC